MPPTGAKRYLGLSKTVSSHTYWGRARVKTPLPAGKQAEHKQKVVEQRFAEISSMHSPHHFPVKARPHRSSTNSAA